MSPQEKSHNKKGKNNSETKETMKDSGRLEYLHFSFDYAN